MDLSTLLSNDNGARARAEAELARLKMSPRELLQFLFHATSSSREQASTMTMGCILLRGMAIRERNLFEALRAEEFLHCRAMLLDALRDESVPTYVRRTLCNTIAAISGVYFNWPELIGYVQEQLSSAAATVNSVQLCLFLLDKLAEHVGPFLVSNVDHVLYWITSYMLEASPLNGFAAQNSIATRHAASLALLSLCHEIPSSAAEKLTAPLEHAVAVLELSVQLGEAELASDFLGALQLLVERRPGALLTAWGPVLSALARICSLASTATDDEVKAAALQAATTMLVNPSSAAYCSNPQTRAAFLQLSMTFLSAIDPHADPSFFQQQSSEKSFGDTNDDDGQEQLALQGAQSLDLISASMAPSEIVGTCLSAAWALVTNQEDWRARRAALFVAAIICESAADALYPLLPQIVPQILALASGDPHPRVRYAALHCLAEMVDCFPGDEDEDDDDEDDDDDGGQRRASFQQLFLGSVPLAACQALQRDLALPRIAAMCVRLLLAFFDPDRLSGEFEVLPQVQDFCVSYIAAPASADGTPHPLFVKQEMVTLLGHVAPLVPEEALLARYAGLAGLFWQILGDLGAAQAQGQGQGQLEAGMLRCKAVEAFALLGSAVGKARFFPDAVALLQQAVQALPRLDASDPLSYYLSQSAARIAGVIGPDFAPFVPLLLPGLVARLAEDVEIEVTADEGLGGPASGSASGSGSGAEAGASKDADVTKTTIYQRGVGAVSIQCNSHQFTDKKMSGRILLHYLIEIPALVCDYVPDIVRALVPLVEKRYIFSDECAEVLGDCIAEALGVFLKHGQAPEPRHAGATAMAEYVIGALCAALDTQQQITRRRGSEGGGAGSGSGSGGGASSVTGAGAGAGAGAAASAAGAAYASAAGGAAPLQPAEHSASIDVPAPSYSSLARLCATLSCLRECLRLLAKHQAKWRLLVSGDVLCACVLLLRDEMLLWLERKTRQHDEGASEELELEEGIRLHVSDAVAWLVRVRGAEADEGAAQLAAMYASELEPFLAREPYATLFVSDVDEDEDEDEED